MQSQYRQRPSLEGEEDAPYLVESHRSSNLPAHLSRLQNANIGRAVAIPMRSKVIQSDPTAKSLPRVLSLQM